MESCVVGLGARVALAQNDSTGTGMGSADAHPAVGMTRRILLVWPVFQAVFPRPFHGFLELAYVAGRACPDYLFGFHVIERQALTTAMNEVGELVLRGPNQYGIGWDAAIVFDDDCFPPHDTIPRLLARCFVEGHPFVAAAGVMRGYPFTTTAAKSYDEGVTGVMGATGRVDTLSGFKWLDDLPNELVDADFCGVPAAIIEKQCFERTARPWFGDQNDRGERVTHDVYFCRKLRDAGIPIKVDGTMRCGHLIDASVITFENRDSARKILEPRPEPVLA